MLKQKLTSYAQLMRLDKPIGTLLLLWPCLWALWLAAEGVPDIKVLVIFCLGVIVMRSAGCVINDYADRKLDGHVKRTANRPLASGQISSREALLLFASLLLLAFVLVLQLNSLTIALSFAAAALAFVYPFMKRFTHLPQFVLGLAFSWAIPMAFAAQTGAVPAYAWLLLLANVLWTVVYDTMYAMVDRDDDLKIGVKSTAILFGRRDKLAVALLQLGFLLCLFWLGQQLRLSLVFQLSLLVAFFMFIYQQYLIKDRDRALCFKAFLHNNQVGLVVFIGIAAVYSF
ncbi:4-hydroxybenzoate octaprenyltransferase [Alginatibacterium sediminis]|uniref:4-hydroxybenzoate octaprenyltransferase n=1 Tax=Alginatibacterium sediminis TaxID=2164068 RepID=A0A420E6P2_9ALTE|nr:4-hydroxybenzoate octaprenyltransferase [Alginatibacterium sediminis]RKF13165.1 4-hydroxybenzoate octaprenyltransferase [Alginatibacterium sediminis]